MKIIIYTDGAARGNPGPAASSFIIQTADGVIWHQQGEYLGVATNNVAEYTAVCLALKKLIANFDKWLPSTVEIRSDSNLIVSQLSGKFKIKNDNLRELFNKIKNLEPNVGTVKYTYVPRSQNFLADKLCNITLDNIS